ncbi:hypothetical protein ACIQF6_02970 [Kitasatospora sp. NPDC092948]|uniref:hypothetical protein n=1 Tax=Kitasatospora sp. NPDC092948 TaxID=3364088 RepID=UPI00381E5275
MRRKVHGERTAHQDAWLNAWVADVELPDGQRFEQHAVKLRRPAVAATVDDRREAVGSATPAGAGAAARRRRNGPA